MKFSPLSQAAPRPSRPAALALDELRPAGGTPFPERVAALALDPELSALPAVHDEYGLLSYARLHDETERLAAFLGRAGLGKGDFVAVLAGSSARQIVALLGVMRSGAAWMPLDRKQPPARLAAMLDAAGAACLITERAFLPLAGRLLWGCPKLAHLLCLDAETREDLIEPESAAELWEFMAVDSRDAIAVSGWKSAWTGEWLAPGVMENYAANTVHRAGRAVCEKREEGGKAEGLRDADVLEIGCGSGLIMRRLAPLCRSYTGVDLSPSAVRHAAGEARERGFANVSFQALPAHAVTRLGSSGNSGARFDVAVMSSVIQGFPGFGYLDAALRGAASLLKPGGRLVLCDVWDRESREALENSLLEHARRAGAGKTVLPDEESLFVPRAFFEQWGEENGFSAEFARTASPDWEMAPYVYDVILRPAPRPAHGSEREPQRRPKRVWAAPDLRERGGETPGGSARIAPEATAYCIFTSGTTGSPKGAKNSHAGLANLADSLEKRLRETGLCSAKSAGQAAFGLGFPFHFDAALVMILAALGQGHCLHVPREETLNDPALLRDFLDERKLAVFETTPSRFSLLLDLWEKRGKAPARIHVLGLGGEILPPAYPERFYALPGTTDVFFCNSYGPTECTVGASMHIMNAQSWRSHPFIPLGRPTERSAILLLDEALRPVPDGMVGEIVICGANVGQGYVNAPDEEAARFVPLERLRLRFEPHPAGSGLLAYRAYRTGDLARRRRDGALEFVRRNDGQLKVQGHRVESGDVTAALLRCPGVSGAAVKLADFLGNGSPALCAYVTAGGSGEGAREFALTIHARLQKLLPAHAVPGWIVPLDELPLTANGKLDHARLPDPVESLRLAGEIEPPGTDTERALAPLWAEILRLEPSAVDVTAGFFTQGGYSLLVLRLLSLMEERFGARMPVAEFFKRPTLRAAAAWLDAGLEEHGPARGREPWSPLVPARECAPERTLPPLCCFHPVGGNILCYQNLAGLLPEERPVYMLQSPGAEEGLPPLDDMPALGNLHSRAIAAALPDAPLVLFGWSMGGLTAWESARQLLAGGRKVGAVILLDSPAETGQLAPLLALDEADSLAALFADIFLLDADALRRMPRERMLDAVIDRGIEAGIYPKELPASTLRRLFDIYAANGRAVAAYRPEPLPVPALLIRPEAGFADPRLIPADPVAGWKRLALGGLVERRIGGSHNTVLASPQVEEVVVHINDFLALVEGGAYRRGPA